MISCNWVAFTHSAWLNCTQFGLKSGHVVGYLSVLHDLTWPYLMHQTFKCIHAQEEFLPPSLKSKQYFFFFDREHDFVYKFSQHVYFKLGLTPFLYRRRGRNSLERSKYPLEREISPWREIVTHSPWRRTLLVAESPRSHPCTHPRVTQLVPKVSLPHRQTNTHTHACAHTSSCNCKHMFMPRRGTSIVCIH